MDEFNIDIEQTDRPSNKMDGSNTRRTPYLSISQPTIGEVITMPQPNRNMAKPIEAKLQPNSSCSNGANELKLKTIATAHPIAVPTTHAKSTYHP